MKIVILDGNTIGPGAWNNNRLDEFGEVTVFGQTPDELAAERIGDAALVCVDGTKIDRAVIDRCTGLRWIGKLGTGYDNIDINYAREKGITVCNCPNYSTQAVSQHSFALLFHLCHHLSAYSELVNKGMWSASAWNYPIKELSGKTIGIFGFGEIAKNSAKIAEALGMNVLICTGHADRSFETPHILFAEKENVFENADIISLHCPLRPDNIGFINRETIALMKDGVIIINTARGALINEEDLAEALQSGKVAGAGLDVLAQEPAVSNPLFELKNCIITPHIGWNSTEARTRVLEMTIDNLKAYLSGSPVNCVN